MSISVEQDVTAYLATTKNRYQFGQPEYYARLALEQALLARQEGNYGIGAVAVLATADTVSEFPNRNAMITGPGVIDHAETRALIALQAGEKPSRHYLKNSNQWTETLREGITVFGTLEPCPMCVCALTNAGARLSVSTVLDGKLVTENGVQHSDGGAAAIGEKINSQPGNWKWMRKQLGLEFILLKTEDKVLQDLSWRVFADTNKEVGRKIVGRAP